VNRRICRLLRIAAFVSGVLAGTPTLAQNAYITNGGGSGTVSVIDTATGAVTATINVGLYPRGVAVTPDGSKVYITRAVTGGNSVSVIDTATNAATAITDPSFDGPLGVAATPDGSKVYVANLSGNTVSVIATATNAVTATVTVGSFPAGVAVTPDGSKVYVANSGGTSVSVIDTATNTVTAITDPSFFDPLGVAVTPDGSKVYVANAAGGSGLGNTVSVIATATNAVTTITDPSFNNPYGVAVTPDGSKVYVTNERGNTVSAIATATNAVTAITDPSFNVPVGVAVTPDGSKVYVANFGGNSVSVIATATNAVTTITDPSLDGPTAFGVFIQPTPPSIPFSSLSAKLLVTGGRNPAFVLNAFFGLGAGSTGINPPAQPVSLHVGPYMAAIPAGSFRRLASGSSVTVWDFIGKISNVSLALDILSFGNNAYQFGAAAAPVDLTAVPNPVPVSFGIGNNAGSTSVNAIGNHAGPLTVNAGRLP
jgi:YVTN family beta-propeller protein